MILDLAWRQGSPDSNRCQLVTWSKDLALRLWEMGLELQGLFSIRNNFYSNLNLVLIYKKDPNPVLDLTLEQVCSSKS
jgi:hypothetical protein